MKPPRTTVVLAPLVLEDRRCVGVGSLQCIYQGTDLSHDVHVKEETLRYFLGCFDRDP